MGMVIGPVLRRADGYGYDIWTAGKGVTRLIDGSKTHITRGIPRSG